MFVQFTQHALVIDHAYEPGQKAEIPDEIANRLIKHGAAVIPVELSAQASSEAGDEVETAEAGGEVETADAAPGKKRKV